MDKFKIHTFTFLSFAAASVALYFAAQAGWILLVWALLGWLVLSALATVLVS